MKTMMKPLAHDDIILIELKFTKYSSVLKITS